MRDDIINQLEMIKIPCDPAKDQEVIIGINAQGIPVLDYFRVGKTEILKFFEDDGQTLESETHLDNGHLVRTTEYHADRSYTKTQYKFGKMRLRRVCYASGKTKSSAKYDQHEYLQEFKFTHENNLKDTFLINRKSSGYFKKEVYENGKRRYGKLDAEYQDMFNSVTKAPAWIQELIDQSKEEKKQAKISKRKGRTIALNLAPTGS